MININIDMNGEINISQESAGERALMLKEYAKPSVAYFQEEGDSRPVGPDGEPMGDEEREGDSEETQRDKLTESFFKSGWESAIRESQLRYVHGTIEQFWEEQNKEEQVQLVDGPWAEALFQWGNDSSEADLPFPESDIGSVSAVVKDPDIHPVADSGEPELEKNQTFDPANTGVWEMTNDELQSRLDETYNRGVQDGTATGRRKTTLGTLKMISEETNSAVTLTGAEGLEARGEAWLYIFATRMGFEVTP